MLSEAFRWPSLPNSRSLDILGIKACFVKNDVMEVADQSCVRVRKSGVELRYSALLQRICCASLATASVWSVAHAQSTVSGVVTDSTTNLPIGGVEVRVVRESTPSDSLRLRVTTTSGQGQFVFSGLDSGHYSIAARRLGYRISSATFRLDGRTDFELPLRLARAATTLDTVAVTAKGVVPTEYGTTSRMHEFFLRRERGIGQFFTRDSIQASAAFTLADLLRRVRGFRVFSHTDGRTEIGAPRCRGNTLRPSDTPRLTGVLLLIDGVRIDSEAAGYLIGSISAADIEGLEVYRGPSELPVDVMGDACIAIYVWTRGARSQ